MPTSRIAVAVLFAAVLAILVFWFVDQDATTPVAAPGKPEARIEIEESGTTQEQPAPATADGNIREQNVRELADDKDAHKALPQGVTGRVLLPDGTPAEGLTVTLLPNLRSEPLKAYLMTKNGQSVRARATTSTLSDGSFALGIDKPDESLDLRVTGVDYPEIARAPIRVATGEWHDLGDFELQQGLVVQGRVVDAVTGRSLDHATVYLQPNQNLLAAPGRNRGTALDVAADGSFRFGNAPRQGLIDLAVEADGYAPHRLARQQLSSTAANDFTIKMMPGHPLTGIVVDQLGNAVAGAKITAKAHSSKTPQTETTYSDSDGLFEFAALAEGPYRLETTAKNHADASTPIALTDEDIKVVLTRRNAVKLRVLGKNGRDVKSYRLSLKRWFETGIGNVLDYPDRNITPRDYRGKWATIENVPYGRFCFQLTDKVHAKTLSPMFEVREGEDGVEVVATLTTGAAITGTVIDDNGNPVAGANVATLRNGMEGFASKIFGTLGGMIPEQHTTRSTKTDDQGRFRLEALSFADYMVVANHPDYCKGSMADLKLTTEGQVVDAGVLRLRKGAIVTGTATVDGKPTGQIEIKITTPQDVVAQAAKDKQPVDFFSAEARSDNTGTFRFLHRIPPGRYTVSASKPDPNNPFVTIVQMKQTSRELVIRPGQQQVDLSFHVPAVGN